MGSRRRRMNSNDNNRKRGNGTMCARQQTIDGGGNNELQTHPALPPATSPASGSWTPSVVMMGFNSFLRFLVALPLEALATCLAFWMAAWVICEPFIVICLCCVVPGCGYQSSRSSFLRQEGSGPGKGRTMVWTGLDPGLYVGCVCRCVLCVLCLVEDIIVSRFLSRREGRRGWMGWVVVPFLFLSLSRLLSVPLFLML
jgi:hypothetical protein